MKIGIIVYSLTGNTYLVALKLRDHLLKLGNYVKLERVEVENDSNKRGSNFVLKTCPKIDKYDIILFGSPVEAFSLSPVMKKYLGEIQTLKNKKIGCFVTQHFPYPWMGGNRSVKQMGKSCIKKEGIVIKTGIINWSNKKRDQMIVNLVEQFGKVFINREGC